MNREEILIKSRKDNQFQDEMELDIIKRAGNLSSHVGLLVTGLIFSIEAFLFNSFNYSIVAIYFAMESTKDIIKYTRLKDKKLLIKGMIIAIVSILLMSFHFISLASR